MKETVKIVKKNIRKSEIRLKMLFSLKSREQNTLLTGKIKFPITAVIVRPFK